MMPQKYYESRDLIDRLCNATDRRDKAVTFLVGSPLSMPDNPGGYGVPGVEGMIDLIRHEFQCQITEGEFEQYLKNNSGNLYQKAFEFLHGRRGQDTANKIVRSAVWQALNTEHWPPQLPETSPHEASAAICNALDCESEAWILPKTADIFGQLLVTCFDMLGGAVLTTNFDPLIEVSISKHGGRFYRTVLHEDGNLGQTVAEGTHIVHLHGYWHGADTLHTPQQLIHPRPHLRRSLMEIVEDTMLVILGYSGWDDIITTTLMELLSNSGSNPEIMWAFHENEESKIESLNEQLLATLAPGIGRGRVSLYRGIDCLTLLSNIYEILKPNYTVASGYDGDQGITRIIEGEAGDNSGQRQLRIEIDLEMPPEITAEPDQPLFIDHWVGRDQELNILTSVSTPVVFVTGIGGQGKSALAGRFLQQQEEVVGGGFEIWDWRDCREESDRLGTQILRAVEHLSNKAISASQVEVTDIRAIVGMLFQVVQKKRALLVFDNVDQYVDLETLQPVKGLDVLISETQARSHNCLILFTCRPDVQVDESRATRIPLAGLSLQKTRELFTACGIRKEDQRLAEELHQITEGHPLWLRLIIMQAIRSNDGLASALKLIKQGGATLPDTTRNIWGTLNRQQRDVLRTMAELDRPESESRLIHLLPGINSNRVNRALRTLRSFHLVEARTRQEGDVLLGLHPIIREFVRTSFPKKDRERYVGAMLNFLDQMIVRFKYLLPTDPSFEILEHWIRKAEFKITFGRFEEATNTIGEIALPLINRGYSEELIRIATRLFDAVDWAEACSSYKSFDGVFNTCLKELIQFGHETSNNLLTRYESAIPGKSAQYILLCDLKCYAEWHVGQFDSAIRWGEEGERLKNNTSVDTQFSTRHNLALARREVGRISEAIEGFLEGESIEKVVTPGKRIEEKGAAFYGNIGRCLFLKRQLDDADICYIKSAQLLEEDRTHSERNNKGYIRFWIAELLLLKKKFGLAAAFLRAAECMWNDSSPPRAVHAKKELESLIADYPECHSYLQMEDWKVEEEFRCWLDRF